MATTGVMQTEKETAPTRPSETGARTDKETTTKATEQGTHTDKETAGKGSEKASGTERETKRQLKPSKVYNEKCRVADDVEKKEDWEGPQRIKTSLATPEQQAKYRGHLAKIFSKDSVNGVRVIFNPQDVVDVMDAVMEYLKSEPVLIEDVPFGITIVGDLHGQLHDLYRVFDLHAKDGKPGYEGTKYLFLGDYVDRGRQSLEVLMAVFCLKMLYPDDFFLLRGNHEFARINMKEGFLYELLDRYEPKTTGAVYWKINEVFCWLSISAIIGNKYFCAHGGISPRVTRDKLRGIMKPIFDNSEHAVILDLCWSDPAVGLKGTAFNQTRQTSINFGVDACVQALESLECVVLFRGHTPTETGFDNQWFVCYTVFTATAMNEDSFNDGACVDVDSAGKILVHILEVDMKRAERDKRLFGENQAGGNEKTKDEACGQAGIALIQDDE